ncbi:hypothetical protein LEP1GSC047_3975 [Leptospira inadai serovar Lyme str. 10]|uniref:Uncharacterized protein n=2 Tax=Leptospira inadai serovar Lyme TaxID=293084 RepID=V6HC44_9LEPT|nr:hypothetical protein LEP1GSC047_3975 [Leptospira inadai serovar Lyme str. 10]PNV75125.1 hypothetical protein BES34_009505 [Leptospira inadai serovar Lyme]
MKDLRFSFSLFFLRTGTKPVLYRFFPQRRLFLSAAKESNIRSIPGSSHTDLSFGTSSEILQPPQRSYNSHNTPGRNSGRYTSVGSSSEY